MKIFSEAGGFEPTNGGVKVRCLTAWRRPILIELYKNGVQLSIIVILFGQEGIRTPDTVVRSHVL
jgi:hypothetical protein